MLTVGQLIRQLEHLPHYLPVGAIDVDRMAGSQRLSLSVRNVVDVDVLHGQDRGEPLSVWLTCRPANGRRDVPLTVVSKEPCGCAVPLDAARSGSVNLDAIPCEHHTPDEVVARSARR